MLKSYSKLEQEIIVLAAAWDLIGSMVHYGHFVKNDTTQDTVLMFNTREAGKLFSILSHRYARHDLSGHSQYHLR